MICVFQLQHHGTLLSGHAGQRQLCTRWASMFSYARAQPPAGASCLVPRPAADLRRSSSSSSSSTRRKVCSRGPTLSRPSRVCLCSLPACAARVLQSGAVRPDAGPAFDDTVRIFFGAGAGAAAVGSDLSLNLLDMVTRSLPAPPFFGIFFNARLGARECAY